jgi:hypothetical protein
MVELGVDGGVSGVGCGGGGFPREKMIVIFMGSDSYQKNVI